jgi:hypothetical protein
MSDDFDDDNWGTPPEPPTTPTLPPTPPMSPSDPPEMTVVTEASSEVVEAMREAYLSDQRLTPQAPASVSDFRAGDESVDAEAPTMMLEAPSEARANLAAFAAGGFPEPRPPAGQDDATLASASPIAAWQAAQRAEAPAPPPHQAAYAGQAGPMPYAQPQQHYPQQPMTGQGPWGGRMPFQAPASKRDDQQRLLVLVAVAVGAALVALLLIVGGGFLFFRLRQHR